MNRLAAVLGLLLTSCISLQGLGDGGKDLTLERIYLKKPSLSGELQSVKMWLPDGSGFLVEEDVGKGGSSKALYLVDADNGRKTEYLPADRYAITLGRKIESDMRPNGRSEISSLNFSPDMSFIVYRFEGDLYIQGLQEGEPRRLTTAPGEEMFPTLSPDGSKVAFVREYNLYVLDIASGKEKAITEGGVKEVRYGLSDWVYDEELGLMKGFFWFPDNRRLAYLKFDTRPVPRIPMVDYMPHHKKLTLLEYPKPGDPLPLLELFAADVETGGSVRIETGLAEDVYLARVGFTPDGRSVWVQRLDRDKERVALLYGDPDTGKTRLVKEEFSEAWISFSEPLEFLEDGGFIWFSEQQGYRRMFRCDESGRTVNALTPESFGVEQLCGLDEAGEVIYFTGSGENPAERHLFKARLDGTGTEKITTRPGTHRINMSDDCRTYIDTYSTLMKPPRMDVFRNDGSRLFVLDENNVPELEEYRLGIPEFLEVTASDGVKLRALLLKPKDFDPGKQYPVICTTYGGPHAQTVRDSWGGEGWLWSHMLTQKGFLVFWLDHRGGADHGYKGASLMHRKLCTIEWQDQVEGIKFLRGLPYVAKDRVGIWGWSYGGTTAVTCLLKAPDFFQAAAAVAPVLDWRNYDAIYTEHFMDTPAENPDGFREADLTAFAGNLRGSLLLIHGLQDDNVLVQNTFQMAAILQEKGKSFRMMIYPKGGHGIGGAKERRHLFEMITDFFLENL